MMWPFRAPYPVLHECLVNLKGGKTAFRGAVWRRRDGFLVLKRAVQLLDEGRPVKRPLDGELVIPEGNIEFLQVLG
ncbi:MAG: hypothetical protein PHQ60_15625 [Sideroxydans sp.]|nr:hypothetical protein [Sideroxydans sp.]